MKKFRSFALYILITLFSMNFSHGQDVTGIVKHNKTTDYLSIANDLYKNGKYYEAVFYYEIAKKQRNNKNNYELLWNLAVSYDKCRYYNKSIETYLFLNEKDEKAYPMAIWHAAMLEYELGEYKKTSTYLKEYLKKTNGKKTIYSTLSNNIIRAIDSNKYNDITEFAYKINPVKFSENNNPSFYGGTIKGNDLWLSISVKIEKDQTISLKEIKGKYNAYYVDRLFSGNMDEKQNITGKKIENLIYSLELNYLPPAFSVDGNTIYLNICEKAKEPVCNLYTSIYNANEAISYELLDAPFNEDDDWSIKNPFIVEIDKKEVLFLAAKHPTKTKGYDIAYCIIKNGKPGKLVILKSPVNTPFDEVTPFYSHTEEKLYFSSDGNAGKGGFDVYSVSGSISKPWSSLTNMGQPINSSFDDFYFNHNNKNKKDFRAYVSSNREGSNCCDQLFELRQIMSNYNTKFEFADYFTKLPLDTIEIEVFQDDKKIATDTVNKSFEFKQSIKYKYNYNFSKRNYVEQSTLPLNIQNDTTITILLNKNLYQFTAQTKDAKTLVLLPNSMILLMDKNDIIKDTLLTDSTGFVDKLIQLGVITKIQIKKDGYMYYVNNFQIDSAEYVAAHIQREFLLEKIDIGATLVFRNIEFEFNKSELLEISLPELNRIVQFLKENPSIKMEIGGHTDNLGGFDYNKKLSTKRAKSVTEYITSQGIEKNRLEYKGFSYTIPISDNSTTEGRTLNRRVEFKILEK